MKASDRWHPKPDSRSCELMGSVLLHWHHTHIQNGGDIIIPSAWLQNHALPLRTKRMFCAGSAEEQECRWQQCTYIRPRCPGRRPLTVLARLFDASIPRSLTPKAITMYLRQVKSSSCLNLRRANVLFTQQGSHQGAPLNNNTFVSIAVTLTQKLDSFFVLA